MTTYNHMITLCIAVPHCKDGEMPTIDEAMPALLRRVADLLCGLVPREVGEAFFGRAALMAAFG